MIGLYLIKEHIESLLDINLYFGSGGSDQEANFGTVRYAPNLIYSQPYMHIDGLRITLYYEQLGDLMDALDLLLNDLNQENYATHVLNTNEDGVNYKEIEAMAGQVQEYSLIDEKQIAGVNVDIVATYGIS